MILLVLAGGSNILRRNNTVQSQSQTSLDYVNQIQSITFFKAQIMVIASFLSSLVVSHLQPSYFTKSQNNDMSSELNQFTLFYSHQGVPVCPTIASLSEITHGFTDSSSFKASNT